MSNDLTTDVEFTRQPPAAPDVRSMIMSATKESVDTVLMTYIERRDQFREWLLSQLIEGVHYGYPPGLEPKLDEHGNMLVYNWKDKSTKAVPRSQWRAKQSLYKAGADFVCDLMNVRDEYAADMDGWQQLGGKTGMFVYACKLVSRATGELLGEGRGAREVGQKGGDANNAIKMAKKSAKVDAVLNVYGLSDLFTQDTEDAPQREVHQNPMPKQDAPKVPPRAQRQPQTQGGQVEAKQITELFFLWQGARVDQEKSKEPHEFREWVQQVAGIPADGSNNPANWTPMKVSTVRERIMKGLI